MIRYLKTIYRWAERRPLLRGYLTNLRARYGSYLQNPDRSDKLTALLFSSLKILSTTRVQPLTSQSFLAHYLRAMALLGRGALSNLAHDYAVSGTLLDGRYAPLTDPLLSIDLKEAEREAIQAIELAPDCAEAHYALGFIFRERGEQMSAALEFLLAAASRSYFPKYDFDVVIAARALHEAGVLLAGLGYAAQAEMCQLRALNVDWTMTRAHVAQARFLVESGNAQAAARHMALSLRLRPVEEVPAPVRLENI